MSLALPLERRILIAIHKYDIQFLRENIADIPRTPEVFAVVLGYSNLEIFLFFINEVKVDYSAITNYNILFRSCGNMKGNFQIAEYILNNNMVPLNPKLLEDCLYNASLRQNIILMEILINFGAKPSIEIGCNSIKLEDGRMLKLLVKHGLDIEMKNPTNQPDFSVRRMAEYYKVDIDKLLA